LIPGHPRLFTHSPPQRSNAAPAGFTKVQRTAVPDDTLLLMRVLEDYVHSRCGNCRRPAPRDTYLCDACWTKAAAEKLSDLMLNCTPELRPN